MSEPKRIEPEVIRMADKPKVTRQLPADPYLREASK